MADGPKVVERVYDNVHGYIGITQVEQDIIYSPTFQRLRHIKQMGLVNLVFPGAEHTRFAHCLGVMEIVSRLTHNFDMREDEQQLVRVAALLHDVGHFPLSHAVEETLQDDYETKVAQRAEQANLLKDGGMSSFTTATAGGHRNRTKLHEQFGKELIIRGKIRDLLERGGISPELVAALSTGEEEDFQDNFDQESDDTKLARVLRELLHSQIDADRIDYLMRDSAFTGLEAGGFDLAKLYKEARWNRDQLRFGFDADGLRAVEQFLMSRLINYRRIVLNKYVHAFEYMASKVWKFAIDTHGALDYEEMLDCIKDEGMFLRLNDHYFANLLSSIVNSNKGVGTLEAQLARRLMFGQPIREVMMDEFFGAEDEWAAHCQSSPITRFLEAKDAICRQAGVSPDHVFPVDNIPPIVLIKGHGKEPVHIVEGDSFIDILKYPASIMRAFEGKAIYLRRLYVLDGADGERLLPCILKLRNQGTET